MTKDAYVPITATPSGGVGMATKPSATSFRGKFLGAAAMISMIALCIVGYSYVTNSSLLSTKTAMSGSTSPYARTFSRASMPVSRGQGYPSSMRMSSPYASRMSMSSRMPSQFSSRLSASSSSSRYPSRMSSRMPSQFSPRYPSRMSSRMSSRMPSSATNMFPPTSGRSIGSASDPRARALMAARSGSPFSRASARYSRMGGSQDMSRLSTRSMSRDQVRASAPRTVTGGATTSMTRESSNDCATTAKGACTGEITSDTYTAVRQCSNDNGAATKCLCFGRNAVVVSSELSGPRCYCDFAKEGGKKATWSMFLFCQ